MNQIYCEECNNEIPLECDGCENRLGDNGYCQDYGSYEEPENLHFCSARCKNIEIEDFKSDFKETIFGSV